MVPISFLVCGVMAGPSPQMPRRASVDQSPYNLYWNPMQASRKAVGVWLLAIAVIILAMVTIGGLTRITGSGLSITEWDPIMGAIPPLTDAQWADAFAKYQKI